MRKRTWTDEQFINAVKNNKSIAGVLKEIGLNMTGANYKSFKMTVTRLELDTSHFTGCGHLKNKNHNWGKKKDLKLVLVEKSDYTCSSSLKKRLINEGVLQNYCSICGIDTWNGLGISLQLDHINGNNIDNRIENLRILCPNCHSQTNNFAGKNARIIRIPKQDNICKTCGGKTSSKLYENCSSCYNKSRSVD